MAENPQEKHVKKRVGPISKKMYNLFVRYLQSKEIPTFQELQEAGFRWSQIGLTDNQSNDEHEVDVCNEDASRGVRAQSLSTDVPRQLKSTAFERFKSWARRMHLGKTGKLVYRKTGKLILPTEEFRSTVMKIHTKDNCRSRTLHRSIKSTISVMRQQYTVGRRQYGISLRTLNHIVKTCQTCSSSAKSDVARDQDEDKLSVKVRSTDDTGSSSSSQEDADNPVAILPRTAHDPRQDGCGRLAETTESLSALNPYLSNCALNALGWSDTHVGDDLTPMSTDAEPDVSCTLTCDDQSNTFPDTDLSAAPAVMPTCSDDSRESTLKFDKPAQAETSKSETSKVSQMKMSVASFPLPTLKTMPVIKVGKFPAGEGHAVRSDTHSPEKSSSFDSVHIDVNVLTQKVASCLPRWHFTRDAKVSGQSKGSVRGESPSKKLNIPCSGKGLNVSGKSSQSGVTVKASTWVPPIQSKAGKQQQTTGRSGFKRRRRGSVEDTSEAEKSRPKKRKDQEQEMLLRNKKLINSPKRKVEDKPPLRKDVNTTETSPEVMNVEVPDETQPLDQASTRHHSAVSKANVMVTDKTGDHGRPVVPPNATTPALTVRAPSTTEPFTIATTGLLKIPVAVGTRIPSSQVVIGPAASELLKCLIKLPVTSDPHPQMSMALQKLLLPSATVKQPNSAASTASQPMQLSGGADAAFSTFSAKYRELTRLIQEMRPFVRRYYMADGAAREKLQKFVTDAMLVKEQAKAALVKCAPSSS